VEKEIGQIKVTETDDGFRVDIIGKSLKEALPRCCVVMCGEGKAVQMACCPPCGDEKKEK